MKHFDKIKARRGSIPPADLAAIEAISPAAGRLLRELPALVRLTQGLMDIVMEHLQHDAYCPEDDTCTCEQIQTANEMVRLFEEE